mmetsp:Transcript_39354/g.79376  ORF Transcript_39354/g.79376 Transcript_39354/m.79376 type:complete len:310 (-) Transcript_39354:579-1508(-)
MVLLLFPSHDGVPCLPTVPSFQWTMKTEGLVAAHRRQAQQTAGLRRGNSPCFARRPVHGDDSSWEACGRVPPQTPITKQHDRRIFVPAGRQYRALATTHAPPLPARAPLLRGPALLGSEAHRTHVIVRIGVARAEHPRAHLASLRGGSVAAVEEEDASVGWVGGHDLDAGETAGGQTAHPREERGGAVAPDQDAPLVGAAQHACCFRRLATCRTAHAQNRLRALCRPGRRSAVPSNLKAAGPDEAALDLLGHCHEEALPNLPRFCVSSLCLGGHGHVVILAGTIEERRYSERLDGRVLRKLKVGLDGWQ